MEIINNKKQLEVSLPIAFENLMGVLMTLIDTVVISTIGVIELGAIGAMSVILSIMEMGIHAIHVSNNTLVAREIGKDDKSQIKLFAGNAILMTVLFSITPVLFRQDSTEKKKVRAVRLNFYCCTDLKKMNGKLP